MDTLLVHGYIRKIEILLQNDNNHNLIPLDIFQMCFDFYFSTKFVFYLSALRGGPINRKNMDDIMCAASIETKRGWKISIHELEANKQITINDNLQHKWSLDVAGITFARNINLPKKIHHQLSDISCSKYKFNNLIFRCGGRNKHFRSAKYCGALILNSHQFEKPEKESLTAYNWELPALPKATQSSFLLYSYHKKALFSIGGWRVTQYSKEISKLSLGNNAYLEQNLHDWKWECYAKIPTTRGSVCAAMIDKSTKLIVIGGHFDNDTNKVELLDMDKNVWIDVKDRKEYAMDSGIYYDDLIDLVYVGGGYSENTGEPIKFVECYDLKQNVWQSLPNTTLGHDMNPLMWVENNNLLHIMSVSGNGIEHMDLREGTSWSVINDDLSTLFHTSFDIRDVSMSRIVGN